MLCDAVAADRRANPRDDIMTALVQAEIDGERLDDAELNLFFVTLVVAGNETTRNLINHSMLALIEHPDQAAAAARRPVAVGHRRRGDAPLGQLDPQLPPHRHARHRAAAACRSRRATRSSSTTPRPTATRTCSTTRTRFDVGRTPNDHVTFGGGGVHFCLGASLARAEIKATMRQLVERLPDLELAGAAEPPALRLRQRHQDDARPLHPTADDREGLTMHTDLCDELGIEFPIFAFTHCRDVVVAVQQGRRLRRARRRRASRPSSSRSS